MTMATVSSLRFSLRRVKRVKHFPRDPGHSACKNSPSPFIFQNGPNYLPTELADPPRKQDAEDDQFEDSPSTDLLADVGATSENVRVRIYCALLTAIVTGRTGDLIRKQEIHFLAAI